MTQYASPASPASPAFVAVCEIDLAFTYSLSHPKQSVACATLALSKAIEARRPDLAYTANTILSIVGGR